MDFKTWLILGGMVFLLWSCGGVNAQEQQPQINPTECYSEINTAVRDDWASLSPLQRAVIGFKSIQVCEGK